MRNALRLFVLALLLAAGQVHASFHLWTMTELYSNADGSVQYLEMQTPFSGQQFLGGHGLTSSFGGITHTWGFPSDLPGDSAGRTMLIATAGFAAAAGISPDYVVPDGFFFPGGGTINFGEGSDIWNHGAVPGGTQSLNRNGTTGTASPQNFAGQTGTIAADLSLVQSTSPTTGSTGKDVVFTLVATNFGSVTATDVVITSAYEPSSEVIWASPGCARQGMQATYTCSVGTLASNESVSKRLVMRRDTTGSLHSFAEITSPTADSNIANNTHDATANVTQSPVAASVTRYRLYSPVTREHHFTTDFNEYTVLGGNGNWNQEGTVGHVLDNPGIFNGVTAVPYYRLYNTNNQQHHWTTDANEYYTLIDFSFWTGEGVDGYILPTNTLGATQLYRLLYPFVAGLHHWTIDANEYNTLISTYGWIGEGGSGYVIP